MEQRNKKKLYLFLAIGLLLSPAFALDITTCANLNGAGATYMLQNSVTATGSCFNVTAANVVLGCKKQVVITGSETANTYGVHVQADNFQLTGCEISNFTIAVLANGSANTSIITISMASTSSQITLNSTKVAALWIDSIRAISISGVAINAHVNAFGFRQTGQTTNLPTIQSMMATGGAGNNVVQIDAMTQGTFLANTITSSASQAVYCASCNSSSFTSNTLKNTLKGTSLYLSGSSNTISANNINASASTGVQYINNGGTTTNSNQFTGNTVHGKTAGININTAHFNTLSGNTFFCTDGGTTAITTATAKFTNITGNIMNRPNGCANGITLGTATNDTLIRNNSFYVNSSGAAVLLSSVTATAFRNNITNNTLTQGNSTLQNSFVIQISTANPANTSITWNRMTAYSGTFFRTAETGAKLTNFSRNNMTGNPPLWINNTNGVGANFSFNIFPNTSLYDAYDTGGDGYADVGTEIPFSNATLGNLFPGQGSDANPGMCRPITPTGLNWTSPALNNTENTSRYMLFAWNYTPAGNWGTTYCILSVNGTNHTMSQNSSVGGCTHLWDGETDGYGQFNITGYVIRHSNSLNTTNSTLQFNYTLNEPLRPTNCTWINPPINNSNTTNSTYTFQWQCNMNGTNISACYLQVQNSSGYYNVTGSAVGGGTTYSTCFQNLANESTSCGGLSTGTYSWAFGGQHREYFTDKNWNTFTYETFGDCYEVFARYRNFTPNQSADALIGFSDTTNTTYNLPASCENGSRITLMVNLCGDTTTSSYGDLYCSPDDVSFYIVDTWLDGRYITEVSLLWNVTTITLPFCEANYTKIGTGKYLINITGYLENNNSINGWTVPEWLFTYLQTGWMIAQSDGFYPTPSLNYNSTATCRLLSPNNDFSNLNITLLFTNGTYINHTSFANVPYNTNTTWSYNFSNIPVGSTITVLCNYTDINVYAYSIPQRIRPLSFGITEPTILEGGTQMVLILLAAIMAYLSGNTKNFTWETAWKALCLLLIIGFFGVMFYFAELEAASGLSELALNLLVSTTAILSIYSAIFILELLRQVITHGKKRHTS